MSGVLLHAVDLFDAADEAYRLAGMGISATVWTGMGLILVGLPLAASAVWRSRPVAEPTVPAIAVSRGADRLTARHWTVAGALVVALVIDVMKPASLSFIIPARRRSMSCPTRRRRSIRWPG